MKIVGLAGQSGTGKTTIAAHLAAGGGVHIDGDQVGHELLDTDTGVIEAVRDLAGDGVFDGIDITLDWHPFSETSVTNSTGQALNNFQVEFFGKENVVIVQVVAKKRKRLDE